MCGREPELARFVECPRCGGEGQWEGPPWGVDYRDGSVLADLITCPECNGTGSIEEDAQPVTQDDLDEIEAAETCPSPARWSDTKGMKDERSNHHANS